MKRRVGAEPVLTTVKVACCALEDFFTCAPIVAEKGWKPGGNGGGREMAKSGWI